jgi:hypothetical protein
VGRGARQTLPPHRPREMIQRGHGLCRMAYVFCASAGSASSPSVLATTHPLQDCPSPFLNARSEPRSPRRPMALLTELVPLVRTIWRPRVSRARCADKALAAEPKRR